MAILLEQKGNLPRSDTRAGVYDFDNDAVVVAVSGKKRVSIFVGFSCLRPPSGTNSDIPCFRCKLERIPDKIRKDPL